MSGAVAPFPRPTGMPEVLHGDGAPEGIQFAPQGSLYLRRDGGDAWHLYVKSTAVTVNTGWLALPGQELDFAQITANSAAITATTEATSQTVIQGNSVYYDGSRVKITLGVPKLTSSGSNSATWVLYRDSTVLGQSYVGTVAVTREYEMFEFYDTPPVGAHTYTVKMFVSTNNITVNAGPGGSGNLIPGTLRVTKA